MLDQISFSTRVVLPYLTGMATMLLVPEDFFQQMAFDMYEAQDKYMRDEFIDPEWKKEHNRR